MQRTSSVTAIVAGATLAIFVMLATTQARANTSTRFLALGDSYTIGEGVAENERWPVQLVKELRRDKQIDAPEIVASTGWTTDELASAMRRHTFRPPYALVTLLIGVNNQYRGQDMQNYRDQFRALVVRAIELAGADAQKVIVVSIPDWGVTPFGHDSGRGVDKIAREIEAFNVANAQIAASLGTRYVDVTGISREAGSAADALVADGLHPSGEMYRRWSAAILPTALNALQSL